MVDTFGEFKTSLMSVWKTTDDDNVLVFTREDVKVVKDADICITCKGQLLLTGTRNERGRYRIPLAQHRVQWQPKKPTKAFKKYLREANSVYGVPTAEEAIACMHATWPRYAG